MISTEVVTVVQHIDDWMDKDEYTSEELKEFRGLLIAEKTKVLERLRSRVTEAVGDASPMPDDSDQARQITEQAFVLRLADKETKLLRLIDKALKKFETGEYGFCEGTGDLINPARLSLRPWTRYSIDYKEDQERAKKGFAKPRTHNESIPITDTPVTATGDDKPIELDHDGLPVPKKKPAGFYDGDSRSN